MTEKIISREKLSKMRACAPLLPDPGPEVAVELLDHADALWAQLATVEAELATSRAEIAAAGQIIEKSGELRDQLFAMLTEVALTIWGPAKVGESYPFADLHAAVADLKARAPAGGLVIPGRTNGHDLGAARQLYDLRKAVADRDGRIRGMEFGLRTACSQRDRYKEQLEEKQEELDAALELAESWKKRAEKHGRDVSNGDPDCG